MSMVDKTHIKRRICRVEEVFPTAQHFSQYFLHSDAVIYGIYELLMNAIEHGNLEIGYDLKTQLLADGALGEEILARQNDGRYAYRYVDITLWTDGLWSEMHIADCGKGFDWNYYAKQADVQIAHGRGLLIAHNSGFTSLQFHGTGNSITCRGLSGIMEQELRVSDHRQPQPMVYLPQ